MATLKERLDRCAHSGALSTADLAVWFDLPYSTVRSFRRGTEPYPARRPQIEERLQWLERAVRQYPFPVSLALRPWARKATIQRALREYAR